MTAPTMTAPKTTTAALEQLEEAVTRASERVAALAQENGKLQKQLASRKKKSQGAKTDSGSTLPVDELRERLENLERELESLLSL